MYAFTEHPRGYRVKGDEGQRAGYRKTSVEGVHDLAAGIGFDEKTADDRGDDRHAAENKRVNDQVVAGVGDAL